MPSYKIEVLRVETRVMTIEVEADDFSEAHDIAIDKAGDQDYQADGTSVAVEYHTDLTKPAELPPVHGHKIGV